MKGAVTHDLGRLLEAAQWRQGSILRSSLIAELRDELPGEPDCVVVLSQDCDLVRHQDTEWNVELVCGVWVAAPNNAYFHGRHTRKLALSCTDELAHLELDIRQRCFVSKEKLIDAAARSDADSSYQPDLAYLPDNVRTLAPDAIRVLASWMGQRYTRPAFPDAFNKRLESKAKKIEALTKKQTSCHVTAVYLMLNTEEELEPAETYEALLWFACKQGVFESGEKPLLDVKSFASEYVTTINECPGVTVIEGADGWEVRGEHQISVADLREFKRFNYDHRSLAETPGGDLPADVER